MRAFSLLLLLSLGANAQQNGLTVPIQQGSVSGTFSSSDVRQFLGIPYATAGRWQAPQAPPVRDTIWNANSFGDSCVQSLGNGSIQFLQLAAGGQGIDTPESENCLTVNIWSPSLERKQNTAVLLWIYGGGQVFGTSNMPIYDGNNFVRDNDDITVVTFNYRMNIFGQPNAPQLLGGTESQNFGLLDLDAAVSWVHDNIANFGGDPERITLFGQSAGALYADQHTFAHPQDTKVKGVILQSGTATLLAPSNTFDPTPWNTVANAVGCGTVNNTAQFDCMKAVPFATLQSAVLSTGSAFNRVVDNINVFSDTLTRAAAGNLLKVPAVIGSAANEADVFVLSEELNSIGSWVPVLPEMLSDILTLATQPFKFHLLQAGGIIRSLSGDTSIKESSLTSLRDPNFVPSTLRKSPSYSVYITQYILSRYIQRAWVEFARDPQQGLVNFEWLTYNPLSNSLAELENSGNPGGVVLANGLLVDIACGALDVLNSLKNQLEGLLGIVL